MTRNMISRPGPIHVWLCIHASCTASNVTKSMSQVDTMLDNCFYQYINVIIQQRGHTRKLSIWVRGVDNSNSGNSHNRFHWVGLNIIVGLLYM